MRAILTISAQLFDAYCITQMAKLSSEYYHLVPQSGYAYEKIRPIDRIAMWNQQSGVIQNLLEYEMIAKILAGAQHRIKGLNIMLKFCKKSPLVSGEG